MNKIKYEIFCHNNFLFFYKHTPVIKTVQLISIWEYNFNCV